MPSSKRNLYFSSFVACCTSLLFGYSVGHIGGIIVLPRFLDHFSLSKLLPHDIAEAQARIVTFWILGCTLGVPLGQRICKSRGRKPCLALAGLLYLVGTIVQLAPIPGERARLHVFLLGRLCNGLGVGAGTLVGPLYLSETSTTEDRGILLASFQILLQLGALVGFWSAYFTHSLLPPTSDLQWQVPVAIGLIPGLLLVVGSTMVPETPQYLSGRKLPIKLLESLVWLRQASTPSEIEGVQAEQVQLLDTAEREAGNGPRKSFWRQALGRGVRNRVGLGILMMVAQNILGLNAVNYYAPTIFKSAGFTSTGAALFLTGLFGAIKLVFSVLFTFWLVRKSGLRFWLKVGAGVCAGSMFLLAYLVRDLSNSTLPHDGTSIPGVAAVVLVYLFTAAFTVSFGPLSWSFCAEIFPLQIRSECCTITTVTQWVFQFVVAYITPILLSRVGWLTYFIYALCGILVYLWVEVFVPETRGVEDMDSLFGAQESETVDEVTERSRLLTA
ncbi:general substrate transporter [Meredithblackwellia eburnea MCA 4105]